MVSTCKGAGMWTVGTTRFFVEVIGAGKGQFYIRLKKVNHSKGWGAKPLV